MSGIKTMKKMPITEENFEAVLQQMQKICGKYKMIYSEKYFSEDGHTVCKYKPIVFKISHGIHIPYCKCEYVEVEKAKLREEHEKGNTALWLYPFYGYRPLIDISLDNNLTQIILDDQIKFLPFGLGFTLYPSCGCYVGVYECNVKILFMANILNGRIKDVYAEKL